ncbi:hypothetical protein JOC70_001550 [Clostridium pascui]|uniref:DNRLRE domain-containing protein n=1 Tax=Clostridium pascui TaxID=46609 RepID=UPI0019592851|nr:DNRLRE domain-containing protein [Clostridium pascui]MBM7870080.1 hypothetical protein [Clostridium pascui]
MSSIDIPASKSLTLLSNYTKTNIRSNVITIGKRKKYDYISYLYFELPLIPANMEVYSAEIVLFKTGNSLNEADNYYWIYPLLEDFSTYTNYYNRPNYESSLGMVFSTSKDKIYSQINITPIILQWINNNLSNKGLTLFGRSETAGVITYGSALNKDKYLVPFLRMYLKRYPDNCCIKTVPISCKYSILPPIGKEKL